MGDRRVVVRWSYRSRAVKVVDRVQGVVIVVDLRAREGQIYPQSEREDELVCGWAMRRGQPQEMRRLQCKVLSS